MHQPTFRKSALASAVTLSLYSVSTIATVPNELLVDNLQFSGTVFSSGGQFNQAGTVGPFNPAVDLVPDPNPPLGLGGRMPAPGFDQATASGNIFSFDHFFGHAWEGEQRTEYLSNTDVWNDMVDPAVAGPFNYDAELAAMDDEQVAIGMFFQWNGNAEIAVLEIFDCDANQNCTGNGVPMQNGPFSGSIALFNASLSCTSNGLAVTDVDTPIGIDIAADVLGTDVLPSNCTNPTDPADPTNPTGLMVDSVSSPSTEGGTVVLNGTDIDYSPLGGFEGSDTFSVNISDATGSTTTSVFTVQVGGQLQSNFTMLDVNGGIIGGTNDVDIVWDEVSYNDPAIIPGSDNGDGFGIPAETTGVMMIGSPTPFRGFNWFAKNVRVYQGPIKLKFDIACTEQDYINGTTDCSASPLPPENVGERYIQMELLAGEIGAHMIFDWGKDLPSSTCGLQNCDIDVINIWHEDEVWPDDVRGDGYNELYTGAVGIPPKFDTTWDLISVAKTPGAVIGTRMIDGAFKGSNANFNYNPLLADSEDQTYTGNISDTEASLSMGLPTLLAGLFSLFGLRRLANRKAKQ